MVTRNDKQVKLADFGLSTLGLTKRRLTASPRRMSRCGTAMYRALALTLTLAPTLAQTLNIAVP